jgi:LmbE family N-acetylglucosaminyl deacetylase
MRWLVLLTAALLVATVSLVFLLEMRRRQALYWYDVTADYRFGFSGPDVQRFTVRLAGDGFTFPAVAGDWDTAVLRLDVRSELRAAWSEPSISVEVAGGGSCQQYFERRAAGTRFVNLCLDPSRIAPGAAVGLRGTYLGWVEGDAELLVFSSALPDSARLLFLAPHPDDAEIAAFGLYAQRDSWIATITNGSYGGDAYASLLADRTRRDSLQARLRVWDSLAGPFWAGLGPGRAVSLGYFTLGLEAMYQRPERIVANPVTGSADIGRWRHAEIPALAGRPAQSTWEGLVGDLMVLLTEIRPQAIVFPHPALDANRDHVFTAAALLEALERLHDPPLRLVLYTNHHARSEYYPFGPADAAVTLPPWFDETTPVRALLSHPLDRERQVAKLFALDAMHDLRPAPAFVLGDSTRQLFGRLAALVRDARRDPARELSYFRRAARPNELFFVYGTEDRSRLQQLIPVREASLREHREGPMALSSR